VTGRERTLAALAHREADRIPIDYWADAEVSERLQRALGLADQEALLARLGVDLRYVSGPSCPPRLREDGLIVDHWGVARRPITVEGVDRAGRAWRWSYQHVACPPLEHAQSVRELEEYTGWPDAAAPDMSGVRAECERARASGAAVVCGGDRLDRAAQLKPATYLRGLEQFMSDLLLAPALAECLIERIVDYYLAYNERVFEAARGLLDIFFMGDDMGSQAGLLVSPRHYRKFFKANFRRLCDLARRFGLKTMYHTCGNVAALVPDFIDCGLDVLQSLQPAAMDLPALKREYGGALAFQGGIDIQQTMPQGTPEEVRREVAERARVLGPGGGYIFCTAHNLLPDVPTENALALFEAYLEHGRYR
jgi:uroporphyrinogen decarboxylase